MDLRVLEYFAVAAELEHIGKAAGRLHISQSPLSRQIRQLEKELDLELFTRERQRVRLTESGKWLLSHARNLLAYAERIRDEAAQRARGKIGTLAIAFVSGAMRSGLLPPLLRRFHAEFPKANIELHNLRSKAQMEAVASGSIDIGFVSMAPSDPALEVTPVAEEPFVLVLPVTHPLARKRGIAPPDLNGAKWVLISQSIAPDWDQQFLAACASAGFTPASIQRVNEPNTLLGLVESGFGVGLLPGSARNYAPHGVRFRALPWIWLKSRTYMVRPIEGRQQLSNSFAAYLRSVKVDQASRLA